MIKLASQTLTLGSMLVSMGTGCCGATGTAALLDEARLFSGTQAKSVQRGLEDLAERTQGRVEFLTLRGLPGRGEVSSEHLSDDSLSQRVEEWAKPKRLQLGPRDLWLVVSVKPEYLFLAVGDALKANGNFGPEKSSEVIRTLTHGFKSQSFTEATLDALGQINRLLQPERVGRAERSDDQGQRGLIFWIWLLGGLSAAFLGYWLAPRLISSSSSAS